METRRLGRSELEVSRFCLGTMTWGSQNSAAEAFDQIDYALDQGINLIDTAEMYPTTPLAAGSSGDTERIIGDWLKRSGRRADVLIATKIVGLGNRTVPDRHGAPISPDGLRRAIEGSLQRLGTDYVDLYQLHWPNRGSYHFRQSFTYAPEKQRRGEAEAMLAILATIESLREEGKLRCFGLSNETAWGTAKFLELAERHNLPRAASIQNEYSLACRLFDLDLAELCHHEEVGLLAFSPLAAGFLTGKYLGGARPDGSRGRINGNLGGRISAYSEPVIEKYVGVARRHGLDPAQMALAFVASRPFTSSVILGATSLEQLRSDIAAADLVLAPAVLEDIAEIYRQHPRPF